MPRYLPTRRFSLAVVAGIVWSATLQPVGSRLLAGLPEQFTAVDTSKLLGSPDPRPLRTEVAFGQLKFERPVELTFAPGDRGHLYVVEQAGVIRRFSNAADVAEAPVYLDLRDVVLREGNEEGLLGLAFHPDHATNGEFFVYYSAKPPRRSVISRFKADPATHTAARESEQVLLEIPQPYANHNGGSMKFGPDGFLYIGLGDGGLAHDPHSHGQNLETLLGKILRIDVNIRTGDLAYGIPADNPFVGRVRARPEIWAYGFRNPWRMAFDRETGELWTGDVGQNRFEEIDLVERGGNYGWNIREGFHDFEPHAPEKPLDLRDPVVEYFRDEGISVTGGIPSRGQQLKDYRGSYFFADYVSGNVWHVRRENGRVIADERVCDSGLPIAAFGEDEHGEMYLCAFDGQIHRLVPREQDAAAIAKQFPQKLSETGLFQSVPDNVLVAGAIPYEVNVPFWSDYTVKDRYLILPKAASIGFDPQNAWTFPVGTVFVKTFWMHQNRTNRSDPIRLETRLLVHTSEGWAGHTYVYDQNQREAWLLGEDDDPAAADGGCLTTADGSLIRPVSIVTDEGAKDQRYYFPDRVDCLACHTKAAGFVLGWNTRQINRDIQFHGDSANQIALLTTLGAFENPPPDGGELERYPDWGFGNFDRSQAKAERPPEGPVPAAPTDQLEVRARAWLDVNCSMCHRKQSIAPGALSFDFHTPLKEMRLLDAKAQQGQLSPQGTPLVTPGDIHASELERRLTHRGPRQMPPLATNLIDDRGVAVIRRWIESLKANNPVPSDP
jgi:uncharacterized repeat protein (TIGR03806 family)